MSLSLVTLCLALVADEPIAPEKAAAIEQAEQKAQAEVAAKYGNRKPTELSREERKSLDKDMADASNKVLEKNGVDPKAWARESLKKSRDGYAKNKELVKELNEKDKAAQEAAKKPSEPKEIEVQRGVTEENPVVLDEKANEDGTVQVEKGLPPDAQRDQNEAGGDESGASGPPMPSMDEALAAPKPTKGKGGKRR